MKNLPKHQDLPKHQGLRNQLVKLIRAKGIKDENVLRAINEIPRHFFLNSSFLDYAYKDKAFPIAADQTISQPYTVAYQTELLQLSEKDKVLEIGTGSGYQTAVLINLKCDVYSIERQKELFLNTKKLLPKIGFVAKKLIYGDGYKGLPDFAPFDKIVVTAGAPKVPKALLAQLKIGGRLVIPVGDKIQVMTLFIRKSEKEFEKREFDHFSFVPFLKDVNSY
ncbi:MAG: protein-L-isoaspartate(D-aspartate) O-methyltransferase [Flavobacteriaceae bacterium]|nr:protein-L-isoaspartate(D-aspartate) O-methyltransferase [Flavobacteriaceae bacterium]